MAAETTAAVELTDSEWRKRPFAPADESVVLYMWLKSFAHSRFGRVHGAEMTGTRAEQTFWNQQRPVVQYLLRHATTEIACDPGDAKTVWAFACTSGDVVHYFCVKRRVAQLVDLEFAADIVRDLVGRRLKRECPFTYELPWRDSGIAMPVRSDGKPRWYADTTFVPRMILKERA